MYSTSSAGDESPERVTRATFGVLDEQRPRRVLLLCYTAGWQAWDLEHSGGSRGEPHELCSLRDGPVTEVLILPRSDAVSQTQYPLFAVCGPDTEAGSAEMQQPYVVRLYSLPAAGYVRTLPFNAPVLALRATTRVLAVMTRSHVYCLDAASWDVLFSARVQPPSDSPPQIGEIQPFGALALTSRWVAFAAAEPPPPTSTVQRAASAPRGGNAVHVAAHYAKVAGSALLKMGDASIKAVLSPRHGDVQANDVQADAPTASSDTATGTHGTVLVRDLSSRSVVAHFRAHGSPLCSMAATGDLLMTASVHGTCAHVYAIRGGGVQQLYRLQRGFSQALVQHMLFSRDAKWAAICTAKGTTHVFAICPGGGPVSADTHATMSSTASLCDVALLPGSPPAVSYMAGQTAPTETLHAVARVRAAGDGWLGAVTHRVGQAGALVGLPSETGAMAAALRTLSDADTGGEAQRELLVVTPAGSMTRYLLRTRAVDIIMPPLTSSEVPPEQNIEAKTLGVTLVPLERWDVRRCPSWPARHGAVLPPPADSPLPPPPRYEDLIPRPAVSLPADDSSQLVVGSADAGPVSEGGVAASVHCSHTQAMSHVKGGRRGEERLLESDCDREDG